MNDFPFKTSLHDINSVTFKDMSPWRRLNKISNVIVHKGLVLISHVKLLIHMGHIVKNRLFVDYRFEDVKFINMIRKKGKGSENSH